MLFVAVVAQIAVASAAGSGGAPPECLAARAKMANVWDRTSTFDRMTYCQILANASSALSEPPHAAVALREAQAAAKTMPDRSAPWVVQAQALLLLDRPEDAMAALQRATSLDVGALDDPPAMLAWARALARTGRRDAAAQAYRALLPRASGLSSLERGRAAAEAGLVMLSLGPGGLDEAIACLRVGARLAPGPSHVVALLGLSLALGRKGNSDEARLLVADCGPDALRSLQMPEAETVLAVAPSEGAAIRAFALKAHAGALP